MTHSKLDAVVARHAVESSTEGVYTVNLDEFADACYYNVDTDDLIHMLKLEESGNFLPEDIADATDCETWGITPEEWVGSLEQALAKRTLEA